LAVAPASALVAPSEADAPNTTSTASETTGAGVLAVDRAEFDLIVTDTLDISPNAMSMTTLSGSPSD
jgi:hypothetical protein